MTEVFDIRCMRHAVPGGSGAVLRALTRGEAPFALVPEETERRHTHGDTAQREEAIAPADGGTRAD